MINNENKKVFAKIPNDFFYKGGEIFHQIGGSDSFLIYCLLISRKAMNSKVYMSLRDIVKTVNLGKHIGRSISRAKVSLIALKDEGYVDFECNLDNVKNDEVLVLKWIKLYPQMGGVGWIPFYEDDFDIYNKVGNIPYIVMWILRMYTNYETKTSFISITDMYNILRCNRNNIQNAIHLFEEVGLFEVKRGKYYHHEELDQMVRPNNHYKYTGNIERMLKYEP